MRLRELLTGASALLACFGMAAGAPISEDFNAGAPAGAQSFGSASVLEAPLTTDDFDSAGTPRSFAGSGSHAVLSGGPSGSFLRLTPAQGNQNNQVAYDRTTSGATTRIATEFDFRITPGAGRADGMGVAFLNTADHGTSGATGLFSEEANVAGSFGVGLDIFQNGAEPNNNHLSFHSNGSMVGGPVALDPGSEIDLASGDFHQARIVLNFDGPSSATATATLTPDIFGAPGEPVTATRAISGLSPYEARLAFDARTGGQNADHDLDNIRADFGPVDRGGVQLTSAANNQLGGFALPDSNDGRPVTLFDTEFDFRVRPGGDGRGADGFSVNFVRDDNVGAFSESGSPTGVAVGFDTFDNGGGDVSGNHVQVRFDGTDLTGSGIDLDPLGITIEDGAIHRAHLRMRQGELSLTIDGTSVFRDLTLTGWSPFNGRFNFGARTGGAVANHFIDNFSAEFVPEPTSLALLSFGGLALLGCRRRRAC